MLLMTEPSLEYLIKLVIPLICLLNQMDIFQSRESITAHGSQKSNLPMLGHKIASWLKLWIVLTPLKVRFIFIVQAILKKSIQMVLKMYPSGKQRSSAPYPKIICLLWLITHGTKAMFRINLIGQGFSETGHYPSMYIQVTFRAKIIQFLTRFIFDCVLPYSCKS